MPKVLLDLIRLSYRDVNWEMKFSVMKCIVIYMDREKQIYKYNTIINSGKKKKKLSKKMLKKFICTMVQNVSILYVEYLV